jgi:hypothetical protein
LIEVNQQEGIDRRWKASCELLSKTIPPDRIFFLQISDAYKMDLRLKDEPDESVGGGWPKKSLGQWLAVALFVLKR